LLERGVLAPAEAQRTELALKQAREELYAAEDNLPTRPSPAHSVCQRTIEYGEPLPAARSGPDAP